MLVKGRDELMCDFAETYHVFDLRLLPARQVAALAFGLRPDSRIFMKMSDMKINTETMLLALIADTLAVIAWQNTKDGQKGRNRPKSVLQAITEDKKETKSPAFDSAEDFKRWRNNIVKGESHNG